MSKRMLTAESAFFVVLFMLSAVSNQNSDQKWTVTYSDTHICALEGSSVDMSCSYTYPTNLAVTNAFWINRDSDEPVDFSKNESYTHRVTVDCGDKNRQCFLHMTKLTKADAQYQYYCRITTNTVKQNWIGKPGIIVDVTDLHIVSIATTNNVSEGDAITLTCNTTCHLTSRPSFVWSKDGRPVEKKQIINNQLQLHPVSYEDEGSYTCAVRGHEHLPSPPIRISLKCDHRTVIKVLIGVPVCIVLVILCAVIWVWFYKKRKKSKDVAGERGNNVPSYSAQKVKQSPGAEAITKAGVESDSQYYNVGFQGAGRSRAAGPTSAPGAGDDDQYSTIQLHGFRQTSEKGAGIDDQYSTIEPHDFRQTSERGAGDDDQYCTIQPHGFRQTSERGAEVNFQYTTHSKQTAGAQGDDVKYTTVQFAGHWAEQGSLECPEDNTSVIYSRVA